MHIEPGAAAHPPPDWVAYSHLQQRTEAVDTAFRLNSVDRALTRLLEEPDRASSGKTLALRAERDARKYYRSQVASEPLLKGVVREVPPNDPTVMEIEDLENAVGVIKDGIRHLDARVQQAFSVKAFDQPADTLGVKDRQLRNLVQAARAALWQERGVPAAYDVLNDALAKWRYLTLGLCAELLSA
jgi:hypothetical protein